MKDLPYSNTTNIKKNGDKNGKFIPPRANEKLKASGGCYCFLDLPRLSDSVVSPFKEKKETVLLSESKSNSNGSCQKRGAKCHFATLNSVLASMNSVFTPMVGVKTGCHFNNSIFFIKKYN